LEDNPMENLTFDELFSLLKNVFALKAGESMVILVDLPNRILPDDPVWKDRRILAIQWYKMLKLEAASPPFTNTYLACYENVASNNNDLPETFFIVDSPGDDVHLGEGVPKTLEELFSTATVVLAPTQLSATAPLKILAKRYGFRGATLPGFTRQMLPTLALDYDRITQRVMQFKRRMDAASAIRIRLHANATAYVTRFDLRFRTAHASGGLMREPGVVGNLPSGEAYVVPYEGENPGEKSRSEGILPVQFEDEIVLYKIKENKVIDILSEGEFSSQELKKLQEEPAYGNVAEIGIGVLGEWGITAIGSTLVDEKLGLHVAFGRSDHFGGAIGPSSFRDPRNVVHIDRVYVPSVQPLVMVEDVHFIYDDAKEEPVIRWGKYVV
jgi:aminopeptidase